MAIRVSKEEGLRICRLAIEHIRENGGSIIESRVAQIEKLRSRQTRPSDVSKPAREIAMTELVFEALRLRRVCTLFEICDTFVELERMEANKLADISLDVVGHYEVSTRGRLPWEPAAWHAVKK